MPGGSVHGLLLRRVLPFLASLSLLVWAAVGADLLVPPPQPLRVVLHDWIGYDPFFVAADAGFLDPSRVELKRLSSGSAAGVAIAAGTIDAVGMTMDEALLLLQEAKDLRIVLVLDESTGGDAIVARSPIPDLAALRGHRVGVEPDSVGQFLLARAFDLRGVSSAEVEVVPLRPDQHLQAWREGRVDAMVSFEPLLGAMRDEGTKVLFDSREIPGEIVDVMVVRAALLDDRPDDVRHLLQGWFRAIELARSPGSPGEAALARRSALTPEEARRSLAGLRFFDLAEVREMLTGPSPSLLGKAQHLQDWMRSRNLLGGEVDALHLFGPEVGDLYAARP